MMNIETLNTLSEKELLEIKKNIYLILGKRSEIIENALKEYDLECLKKSIEEYSNENFCEIYGWKINFTKISYNNLEFFLYIRKLPGFESIKNSIGNRSKTEEAIIASLNDKKLFDFFINHPDFSQIAKDFISQNYYGERISLDVLNEIFNLKLIEPTKELKKRVLSTVGGNMSVHYTVNFIKYFLKNNTYEFTPKEYIKIYTNTWLYMDDEFFKIFKNKYKEYSTINLTDLMEKSFPDFGMSMPFKYETLIDYSDSKFERAISNHKMSAYDIDLIISGFNKQSPKLNEKFHRFINTIITDFPEHINSLKECNTKYLSEEFKIEYNKAIEYINLTLDLEKKDNKGKSGKTKL